MSAQFKVGDKVRKNTVGHPRSEGLGPASCPAPLGALGTIDTPVDEDGDLCVHWEGGTDGANPYNSYIDPRAVVRVGGAEKVTAEPEDADDLYVEPEPLKAGDWVWVAGQITETHHHPEDVTVEMFSHNEQYQADVRRDRVKPMESMPEWVGRCASLFMADKTTNIRRCTRSGQNHDTHYDSRGLTWKDAAAYGRMEVSS